MNKEYGIYKEIRMIQIDIFLIVILWALLVLVWALLLVASAWALISFVFGILSNPGAWYWQLPWLLIPLVSIGLVFVLIDFQSWRTKFVYVVKKVQPNTALIMQYLWPSEYADPAMPPKNYGILGAGKILYFPFFFDEVAEINLKAEIVDEGKLEVNSFDGQEMFVDVELQMWVIDPIQFFLNGRGPGRVDTPQKEIMENVVIPFLHAAINAFTHENDTCAAENLAKASKDMLEGMSRGISNLLNEYLEGNFPRDEDEGISLGRNFGIKTQVTIQSFDLPELLKRALTSQVSAKIESNEVAQEAEGYSKATKLRAKGIADGVKSLMEAGAQPSHIPYWVLAEAIGSHLGLIGRSLIEQVNGSRGKVSQKTKNKKKESNP